MRKKAKRNKPIDGLCCIKIGERLYLPPKGRKYIEHDGKLLYCEGTALSNPLKLATKHYFCVDKELSEKISITYDI